MATVKELREQAEELNIDTEGLKKAELEEAIRAASFKGIRFKEPKLDPDQVVDLVDETSFNAAAEELEENVGEVMWTYHYATGDELAADDPEDLANLIAEARDDEKLPWQAVAGRARVTKGSAQKLYRLATDRDPGESKIGRGGRGAGGSYNRKDEGEEESKPKPKAKKASAKKATKSKKAAKAKTNGDLLDWDEASEDDIRATLEGKTVTTSKGEVEVSEVRRFGKNKAGKRVIQVGTEDGGKANIILGTIKAVA